MAREIKQKEFHPIVETDVKGAPVKDVKWYPTEVETEGVKIEDPGMGRPIILRNFEFRYPLTLKRKPSKDQIFTKDYLKYLNNLLWIDEMELIQEPKIVFYKKGFRIFCTCQAKRGSLLPSYVEGPKPLEKIIQYGH